jgi:biopolymer transport protein ExbD
MSAPAPAAVKAEPNLTPMLDMVFQLITFFMLVINFKSAEMDLSLELPSVGSARPVKSPDRLLVLNIRHGEGKPSLNAMGKTIADNEVDGFLAAEARASRAAARLEAIDESAGLPDRVVVRADRHVAFGRIEQVIGACQKYGYRQFTFRVAGVEARTPVAR